MPAGKSPGGGQECSVILLGYETFFPADALAEYRHRCLSCGYSADSGCEPLTMLAPGKPAQSPKRPRGAPHDFKRTTAPSAAAPPPAWQLPCWLPARYHCHQAESSGCCCGLWLAGACTKLRFQPAFGDCYCHPAEIQPATVDCYCHQAEIQPAIVGCGTLLAVPSRRFGVLTLLAADGLRPAGATFLLCFAAAVLPQPAGAFTKLPVVPCCCCIAAGPTTRCSSRSWPRSESGYPRRCAAQAPGEARSARRSAKTATATLTPLPQGWRGRGSKCKMQSA